MNKQRLLCCLQHVPNSSLAGKNPHPTRTGEVVLVQRSSNVCRIPWSTYSATTFFVLLKYNALYCSVKTFPFKGCSALFLELEVLCFRGICCRGILEILCLFYGWNFTINAKWFPESQWFWVLNDTKLDWKECVMGELSSQWIMFWFYLEFNQIFHITESQTVQPISDNCILKIRVLLNYFFKLDWRKPLNFSVGLETVAAKLQAAQGLSVSI